MPESVLDAPAAEFVFSVKVVFTALNPSKVAVPIPSAALENTAADELLTARPVRVNE